MARRGDGHHMSKLTEDIAIHVRKNLHKFTPKQVEQLANALGVTKENLRFIAIGRSWKHLDVPVNPYWDETRKRKDNRQRGEDHARSRMTTEFATEVRLNFHRFTVAQQKQFAKLSGFNHISLRDVARGKTWKHLDVPVNPYWTELKRGRKPNVHSNKTKDAMGS